MARSEKVSYWRGRHATIPSDRISGRILMEEDTGNCFLEFNVYNESTGAWEITREQLTDTRKFNTSGGVYTGPVVLAYHPDEVAEYIDLNRLGWSIPHIAATKQYVDDVSEIVSTHIHDGVSHIGFHDGEVSERDYWNQKVDSETGKSLSTNDFTDAFKTKLENIADEADNVVYQATQTEGYELGTISINGVPYTVYSPYIVDIEGNAETAARLKTPVNIDGIEFNGLGDVKHFGVCSTPGSDYLKTCSITNFQLRTGSSAYVKFVENDEIPEITVLGSGLLETGRVFGEYSEYFPDTIQVDPADQTQIFMEWGGEDSTRPLLYVMTDQQEYIGSWYSIEDFLVKFSGGAFNPETDDSYTSDSITYQRQIVPGRIYFKLFSNEFDIQWKIQIGADSQDYIYLNISDTGDYPVYYQSAPLTRGLLHQGLYQFVFDSTYGYHVSGEFDTDTKYDVATSEESGLMSVEDKVSFDSMKTKLAGIEENANNYTLPEATDVTLGGVILGDNITVNSGTISISSQNVIDALGYQPLDVFTKSTIVNAVGAFVGASQDSDGDYGLVPVPRSETSDHTKFLCGNGSWEDISDIDIESITEPEIDNICSLSIDLNQYFSLESYTDEDIEWTFIGSEEYTLVAGTSYQIDSEFEDWGIAISLKFTPTSNVIFGEDQSGVSLQEVRDYIFIEGLPQSTYTVNVNLIGTYSENIAEGFVKYR